jgi:hypothetical protein
MKHHCCHNMDNFTRSRRELEKSPALAAFGLDPSELPDPLVDFRPELGGFYTIQSVVIIHCPWCGAKLPQPNLPVSATSDD